jgi:hypothetical protein
MADSKRVQQGVITMSSIKNAHKYPYMTDLINNGGGLSLEYIVDMKMAAFAFEEGGAKAAMTLLKRCWMMRRPG